MVIRKIYVVNQEQLPKNDDLKHCDLIQNAVKYKDRAEISISEKENKNIKDGQWQSQEEEGNLHLLLPQNWKSEKVCLVEKAPECHAPG